MKAKDIQFLFFGLPQCENSVEVVELLKEFLTRVGVKDVSSFSYNKIVVETLELLKNEFSINKIGYNTTHECGGKLRNEYNLNNIIYDSGIKEYKIPDQNFKLIIDEPPFNINNMDLTEEFLSVIKHIEFPDGLEYKLTDLKTIAPEGEMTELDTFLSFIDMSVYRDIMSLAKRDLILLKEEYCDKCDYSNTIQDDDHILIFTTLLRHIVED